MSVLSEFDREVRELDEKIAELTKRRDRIQQAREVYRGSAKPRPKGRRPGQKTKRKGENERMIVQTLVKHGNTLTGSAIKQITGLDSAIIAQNLHRMTREGKVRQLGVDENRSIIWEYLGDPRSIENGFSHELAEAVVA